MVWETPELVYLDRNQSKIGLGTGTTGPDDIGSWGGYPQAWQTLWRGLGRSQGREQKNEFTVSIL